MKLIVLACLLAYVAAVSTQQDCLSSGLACPRIGRCLNHSQLCDGVIDCPVPTGRNSSVDEGGIERINCKFYMVMCFRLLCIAHLFSWLWLNEQVQFANFLTS